jgi:uncharacterized membrane protein
MLLALLIAIVLCTLVAIVLDTCLSYVRSHNPQPQYTEPTASDQLVVSRDRHYQLLDALDYSERRIRDLEWQRNCAEAHAHALLDSLHIAERKFETAQDAFESMCEIERGHDTRPLVDDPGDMYCRDCASLVLTGFVVNGDALCSGCNEYLDDLHGSDEREAPYGRCGDCGTALIGANECSAFCWPCDEAQYRRDADSQESLSEWPCSDTCTCAMCQSALMAEAVESDPWQQHADEIGPNDGLGPHIIRIGLDQLEDELNERSVDEAPKRLAMRRKPTSFEPRPFTGLTQVELDRCAEDDIPF